MLRFSELAPILSMTLILLQPNLRTSEDAPHMAHCARVQVHQADAEAMHLSEWMQREFGALADRHRKEARTASLVVPPSCSRFRL